jgi:mycothiol synthase
VIQRKSGCPCSAPAVTLHAVTSLATGLTVRPATLGDVPSITALVNAVDVDDIGRGVYTEDETRQDLTAPGADLPRSSWLAFTGSRLVAYAVLWDGDGSERIDADLYALRDSLPAGGQLLDLAAARAGAIVRGRGQPRAVVHLHLTPSSPLRDGWMPDRGWRIVRTHHVLERAVSPGESAPATPPGVRVRQVSTDADRRSLHRIMMDAFTEHFDYRPEDYDHWYERLHGDERDWSLSWLAATEDGVDVGELLAHDDQADRGWVRSLGVLPAGRGRGIGRHLLQVACAEFARRGRERVGLGVDTANTTNALRLYEGLGFTLDWAADTWELTVPVG